MKQLLQNSKFRIFLGIILTALLLVFLLGHADGIRAFSTGIYKIFEPIVIGLILAFVLNPIFTFFETRLLRHIKSETFRRILSLLFTYILFIAVVTLLIIAIFPQLFANLYNFIFNYDDYLRSTIDYANTIIRFINAHINPANSDQPFSLLDYEKISANISSAINSFFNNINSREDLLNLLETKFPSISSVISNTFSFIANLIFSFFISLYLLSSKEKRFAQILRARKAWFSNRVNMTLTFTLESATKNFGNFLKSKVWDAILMWVFSYFAFTIFHMPYPILLATLVGVCNIVPLLGPIIGSLLAFLMVVLASPESILTFIIVVIVLQIVNSYVIAPHIVGSNNGLKLLFVLVSVVVFGLLWGIIGLIVAVPLFSTLCELITTWVDLKLKRKGLSTDLANYSDNIQTVTEQSLHVNTKDSYGIIGWYKNNISKNRHQESISPDDEKLQTSAYQVLYHKYFPEPILKNIPVEEVSTQTDIQEEN